MGCVGVTEAGGVGNRIEIVATPSSGEDMRRLKFEAVRRRMCKWLVKNISWLAQYPYRSPPESQGISSSVKLEQYLDVARNLV